MIIVRFQGGLGNQISQYAFCRLLQKRYPGITIKADLDFYLHNSNHQGYELERVFEGIILEKVSAKEFLRVTGKISEAFLCQRGYEKKLIKIINHFLPLKKANWLYQSITTKYPEEDIYRNLNVKRDWYLDGYWHNYNYNEIMDQLREELKFVRLSDSQNRECEKRIIEDENSISVHVRKGDYVGSMYDILGVDYYKEAIKVIKNCRTSPKFYLFSDNIEMAKKIWTEINCENKVEYIVWNKGVNSYYDMYLMSLCRDNIIANSTFSYWAAQLNKNRKKIVIRPKMQTAERETWDVENWIKI